MELLTQSGAVLFEKMLPPIDRLFLCRCGAPVYAERCALGGSGRCGNHAPECIALRLQELGEHLFDSLDFLEEICASVTGHGWRDGPIGWVKYSIPQPHRTGSSCRQQ